MSPGHGHSNEPSEFDPRDPNLVMPDPRPSKEMVFGPELDLSPSVNKFVSSVMNLWDGPVTWFRENVVLPNRKGVKYYHMRFNRVPTVDECYEDDLVCQTEAHEQWKRDRRVDTMIITILKKRYQDCLRYRGYDQAERCEPLKIEFEENQTNWFIKYGDLPFNKDSKECYFKQLHRMVWERRQAEKKARGEPTVEDEPPFRSVFTHQW